jgi:hypothetical protein
VVDNKILPWLLIEEESDAMKDIVRNIKFPIGFVGNIKNILMKKGDFDGGKMHDWHTFMKVYPFIIVML